MSKEAGNEEWEDLRFLDFSKFHLFQIPLLGFHPAFSPHLSTQIDNTLHPFKENLSHMENTLRLQTWHDSHSTLLPKCF